MGRLEVSNHTGFQQDAALVPHSSVAKPSGKACDHFDEVHVFNLVAAVLQQAAPACVLLVAGGVRKLSRCLPWFGALFSMSDSNLLFSQRVCVLNCGICFYT
jgi:hypothetical protein